MRKAVGIALAVLVLACAGATLGLQAVSAATGCWEAQCFVDGWTPHWTRTFSDYRDASQAAAEHRESNGYRHQVLVAPCE
jgi:hypothetical protein